MKRYDDDIKQLRASIKRLQEIREVLVAAEDVTLDIERSISEIDARLPRQDEVAQIRDGVRRAQADHVMDLLDEAYSLIDEILGPPEDELTGEPVGTPMDPVARGAHPNELRLEDFLRNYKPGSKNKVS